MDDMEDVVGMIWKMVSGKSDRREDVVGKIDSTDCVYPC